MVQLVNVTGFLLAATLIIIIPGPATLFVADKARQSSASALAAVVGIVSGDMVLIALSATGFATLMKGLPQILPILRLLGAAYLVYLAFAMLGTSTKAQIPIRQNQHSKNSGSFWRGLLITISNPKPILFFSSFFPLFIATPPPSQATAVTGFVLLGALFEALNLLYFCLLCCLVSILRQRFKPGTAQTVRLHQACALGLLLCGLAMGASLLLPGEMQKQGRADFHAHSHVSLLHFGSAQRPHRAGNTGQTWVQNLPVPS